MDPTTPPATRSRPRTDADRGLAGILLSNALTLGVALWQQWSVLDLLWPFFIQSLIIGWYARRRLLLAPHLDVGGLKINGRQVTDPEAARRVLGWFFPLHYGFFHLVYAVFLLVEGARLGGQGGIRWPFYAVLALSFWIAHRASHREHLAADTAGPRNAGVLMFMPYLRVVPMHLALIVMANLDPGRHGLAFVAMFMAMKTAADAGMHIVEHRILRR
ncbi:DUF6498-containing protein [Coralloluteibacterium thermophilus]|uniref:DUF6498-containing protein n=1 Tax=Coralloluteibacterium thermophilum TaxID=2707049 RepID=A0ABV9NKZ9_9GAMM